MDTVLIVEDSSAMQKALQRLFEADSLAVQLASDGLAGLESFRKQTPAAVVLDLKLPGMSGKELCREFKALAPAVPIVVLSANSEIEDKVLLLELGADDYVTKPFSPKELLARVRRTMRRGTPTALASEVARNDKGHEILSFGNVQVDFTSMEATRESASVQMTAQEFKVLRFLSRFPGTCDFARRSAERSLGISELSFNADRGQSHPTITSEIGTGSRESKVLSDGSRCWIQIRSGRNSVAG